MTTVVEKLKEVFVPSLITGAAAAGILYVVNGSAASTEINFLSMPVSGAVMIGGSAFVGNMVGEILTTTVLPYAEKGMSKDFMKTEELVVPPALAGLSTYGAVRFLTNLDNVPLLNVGLIGAGSSVVGNYIYNKYESKN